MVCLRSLNKNFKKVLFFVNQRVNMKKHVAKIEAIKILKKLYRFTLFNATSKKKH